jgi:quinol-cytochrome oxidoreductase complex cytochrome b subunit
LKNRTTERVTRIRAVPDLIRKEALAAVIAFAVVCLLSAVFNAPIHGPAHPEGLSAAGVKAPWIFVGIQQILKFLPPLPAGVLIPLAAGLLIALVPFLPRTRAIRFSVFLGVVLGGLVMTIWGYLS